MKVELPFPSEQNPRDFEIFCEDLLCRAQGFETHPRLAQGPLDLSKRAVTNIDLLFTYDSASFCFIP